MQFLAGLPPAYNMISTILTSGDRELKIDEMLPKLLPVEQMTQPERPNEAALAAKPNGGSGAHRGNNRGRNGKFNRQPHKESRTCFYCNKKGHLVHECNKKKRDEAYSNGHNSQLRTAQSP
jgi:hypothetical protein